MAGMTVADTKKVAEIANILTCNVDERRFAHELLTERLPLFAWALENDTIYVREAK